VLVLDAAGLALFAVSGSIKALTLNLNATSAIVLGVLTCIGGGMVRDLLIKEVPIVFRSGFYAMTALAGAIVVVAGDMVGLPTVIFATAGVRSGLGYESWRSAVPEDCPSHDVWSSEAPRPIRPLHPISKIEPAFCCRTYSRVRSYDWRTISRRIHSTP
jgi:hypothetical protein